ncbi:MAG: hypothetical protein AAF489_09660 [Bacteroidota bacterium]
MKSLVCLCLFVFSATSFAQAELRGLTSDLQLVDTYVKRNDKTLSYDLPKNYNGSPYFNDEFVLGNIYQGDELIAVETPMRYNIFSNEIEVKESLDDLDEDASPLTKSSDIWVKINEVIIVLIPFNGSDEEGSYFQVLFEGKKADFLKKVDKKYTTPKKASSSITRDLKGAFTDETTFFLQTKNGRMFQMPKAKNKKYLIFGNHAEALKEYAKENKLNINKEPDLKRLVIHFDSL